MSRFAAQLPPHQIHGQGPGRRYDASTPLPGPKPDYHQPARFDAVTLPAVRESTDPRSLLVARLVAMLDLTPEQAARAVEICEALTARHGPRFAAPDLLRGMASKGDTFYGRFAPAVRAA